MRRARLALFGSLFQPEEAQNIQGLRHGCDVDGVQCVLAIQSECERRCDMIDCDVWLNCSGLVPFFVRSSFLGLFQT